MYEGSGRDNREDRETEADRQEERGLMWCHVVEDNVKVYSV